MNHPSSPERARSFLAQLLGETFLQRHREVDPRRIPAAVAASYRFLANPPGAVGQARLSAPGEDSLVPGLAVLRTHTRDVRFLVDSLKQLLDERGLEPRLVLHPIFAVRRDAEGSVVSLMPASADPDPAHRESLIHVEVDVPPGRSTAGVEEAALEILAAAHTVSDDFEKMRQRMRHLVEHEVERPEVAPPPGPDLLPADAVAGFLRWLLDDNFTFLGARTYVIEERDGQALALTKLGTGLGLLRDEDRSAFFKPVPIGEISEDLHKRMFLERRLVLDKTNRHAPIHRRIPMDYIGVRFFENGKFRREERFVGLFSRKALFEPPTAIPILRTKYQRMLERAGIVEGSFDERELTAVFNALPKEELFLHDPDAILEGIRTLLEAYGEDSLRVFLRPSFSGRLLAIGLAIPDRYFSIEGLDRVVAHLEARLETRVLERRETRTEHGFRQIYLYAAPRPPTPPDPALLEAEVLELLRPWSERLAAALADELDPGWAHAFPPAYQDLVPVVRAAADARLLDSVAKGAPFAVGAVHPGDPAGGDPSATLLRIAHPKPLTLGAIMPVLKNLALEVVDEAAFQVRPPSGVAAHLHLFRVRGRRGELLDRSIVENAVLEGLSRVLAGHGEDDPLNGLMAATGLSWRQVWIVRAYVHHAFQLQLLPSRVTAAASLLNVPALARSLVRWFETRFDPTPGDLERRRADDDVGTELAGAIETVEDPTDYKVFRVLRDLIAATVRTNHFRDAANRSRALAIKLEPARVPGVPRPAPRHEIFVQAPGMEGVHLRGGDVARGGIRFSDRPDDFRIEVLSLMKTQMVKNAIIVPVGAKGGFILTAPPADRIELGKAALEAYQTFVSALLDVTDDRSAGSIVPPPGVVRLDGDDSYLVVAADKGTAAYSDVANAISARYGFWLGDAFASGGSRGYDHKQLGITARGAWECAKTHFRELGVNPERDPIAVVGIGDMSGDVFGNGLLRSRTLRLLGAFNHRHVFLDPEPDVERSFRERERCFREGLGWDGYDTAAISPGGGVFGRRHRAIPVPAALRPILGSDRDTVSGEELIRLLLAAPVDLLWNGGIGTYVKASTESHADAGDKANDAVRVDATQLRCKVVAEGGNLGLTQSARNEYAAAGGRVHTDAIDNSGGVDCSDHEVNVKIALATARARGRIDYQSETRILVEATDEICQQVLEDNRWQSLVLALDQRRSRTQFERFQDLIGHFIALGQLDAGAEGFSKRELKTQRGDGHGFFKPQLAVLLAHEKRRVYEALLAGRLIDRPELQRFLTDYFPGSVRRAIPEELPLHPLKREIVATALANHVVNRVGISALAELAQETGATTEELVGAWCFVDEVVELEAQRHELRAGSAPAEAAFAALDRLETTLIDLVRWNADRKLFLVPTPEPIETYRARRDAHRAAVAAARTEAEAARLAREIESRVAAGLSRTAAEALLRLDDLRGLFVVGALADETGSPPEPVLKRWEELGTALRLPEVAAFLDRIALSDSWDRLSARRLVDQVGSARYRIAARLLRTAPERSAAEALAAVGAPARRYLELVERLRAVGAPRNLHPAYVVVQALADCASAFQAA